MQSIKYLLCSISHLYSVEVTQLIADRASMVPSMAISLKVAPVNIHFELCR
jgi:hypothetical protein